MIEHISNSIRTEMTESEGIRISYTGRTPPWQIVRKVKPRAQNIVKELSVGSEEDQIANLVIEGENLQAMVSLYKYRGQVDLILTDPPYNTGNDFRYNDKWDQDPNDPELGDIVPKDDGSRHSKWLRFMAPRIWMMREMLKPHGVLAICIDERELFRLGILLDEIFDERNRIGIINWQKTYSPKNDNTHISTATEYVLLYARDIESAKTSLLPRTETMNARYKNPDNDPEGEWAGKDPTAKEFRRNTVYGIQSPFTGFLHYPEREYRFNGDVPETRKHWTGFNKREAKRFLEQWGVPYEERDLGDGRGKALVVAGSQISLVGYSPENDPAIIEAREKALSTKKSSVWPRLFFTDDRQLGESAGRPRMKNYLKNVKKGQVPLTYWADEDYETPFFLGTQSWDHEESGHSQSGITELDAILGKGHGFQTVKPLKLFMKIIQLWCPPKGIVMDPFAGSGTTAHAVLLLNNQTDAARRFILIEKGREERGDPYARTLTAERIRRVITGEWAKGSMEPLSGGFRFVELTKKVDIGAVLALEREEMIDLLLVSHWEQQDRGAVHLRRLEPGRYKYLFATNTRNEGYFLVWDGPNTRPILDRNTFHAITEEARNAGLQRRYHVYARLWTYQGPNIEFYQIPDRILAHLGYNESVDALNDEE